MKTSSLNNSLAPAGLTLLLAASSLSSATLYVDANSANSTPPYTNWLTAATNIQNAVDAALPGDSVLVTNGTYATGGRAANGTLTNRLTVEKAVTVRSANGPAMTLIQGGQAPGGTNGEGRSDACI